LTAFQCSRAEIDLVIVNPMTHSHYKLWTAITKRFVCWKHDTWHTVQL